MFTQGKWVARIDDYAIDIIEEKSGFGISDIGTRKELKDANYPNEQAEANAKLISAAPDLLEALKIVEKQSGITWDSKNGKDFEVGAMLHIIREAIKKAEGQP